MIAWWQQENDVSPAACLVTAVIGSAVIPIFLERHAVAQANGTDAKMTNAYNFLLEAADAAPHETTATPATEKVPLNNAHGDATGALEKTPCEQLANIISKYNEESIEGKIDLSPELSKADATTFLTYVSENLPKEREADPVLAKITTANNAAFYIVAAMCTAILACDAIDGGLPGGKKTELATGAVMLGLDGLNAARFARKFQLEPENRCNLAMRFTQSCCAVGLCAASVFGHLGAGIGGVGLAGIGVKAMRDNAIADEKEARELKKQRSRVLGGNFEQTDKGYSIV